MRIPRKLQVGVPHALVASYAVFAVLWAITNAPFSAPDESQHYLRAVGISDGHLIGTPAVYNGPVLTPKETAWRHLLTRAVSVPPGLSPNGFECELFHPDVTPACSSHVSTNATTTTEQTDVGVYQPEPYLLPAAAVRLASDPAGADRAGRVAIIVLWLALLSAAAWALWDRTVGRLSLVGLVVAITPMVVFMGSSLTDSGLEIMASLSFFATLMGAARRSREPRAGPWILAGATGAVLATTRSFGPVWVICDVALCSALTAGASLKAHLRRAARPTAAGFALVLIGIVLNVVWVNAYGPHVSPTLIPSLSTLHDGLSQLRSAWDGVIGVFGYEDVPLGGFGVVTWTVLAVAVLAVAARLAARRERWALLVAVAAGVVLPIYIYAALTSKQGIQTQGRHVLPLFVVIPLMTGEILRRHATDVPRLVARWLFPVTCVVAAGIQLLAWWENSRRYAVGLHGSWWFLSSPQWSPPGGWILWTVVAAGTASAAAVAAMASSRPATAEL
jgi:hypothetical protein